MEGITMGVELDERGVENVLNTLDTIRDGGFQFVISSLVRPRAAGVPFTHDDLIVDSTDESHAIVGRLSTTAINVNSEDPVVAKHSVSELVREFDWGIHIGLPCLLIDSLPVDSVANLARHVQSAFRKSFNRLLWVRVNAGDEGAWRRWVAFRTMCDKISGSMGVLLEVPTDLPAPDLLQRWLGEPVRALSLPTSIFMTNKGGFPVLSRQHQALVKSFLKLDLQLTVRAGAVRLDALAPYRQYLDHINDEVLKAQSPESAVGRGFEDVLQSPLQPLQDNLESSTYQVFERDRIKYVKYEEAIVKALTAWPRTAAAAPAASASACKGPAAAATATASASAASGEAPIVIMVLGAGRGPLVDASLSAAEKTGRSVRVYCVEKNVNALLTLEQRRAREWGDAVTVVGCDMRDWHPPELADIVVSELLGSFGDNELSPECLDGAARLIKPEGISIPSSYTSFMAPLTSARLHKDTRAMGAAGDEKPFETMYVCLLTNVCVLCPPQPVFTFAHPNREARPDNTRVGAFRYAMATDAVVHGFAGYFETTLYGDVMLSTNPATATPDMYSWFPIYIPLKSPLAVRAGDSLLVHMWRCVSKHSVWYEWAVAEPAPSAIHNGDGRASAIGL
eukprot:c39725_g1_i1.p1 GENE.c39725_g1_i1~~c39725_g1_i1.p1  ORF type:complete len:635 (-),score=115.50 c39725_g1_i1:74-1939(-)